MGTAATIKAFTPADLTSFYRAAFRPDNATLVVVGDVTPDRVLPLLETSFGAWQAAPSSAAPVTMPAAPQPAQRRIYLVDKPGAPQTQIRIGTIGVARSTPDFFPIQVLNTILGGSFSSRLNLNLREKRGYTYGASSGFDMRLTPGPFSAQAGVQTDKTSESLIEFFNELNGILKTVPADELARAKNYVALRFPSSFETTGDIARRLEDAIVYRLPDDYYSRYVQNIEAITAADVQRVAQKYIQPGPARGRRGRRSQDDRAGHPCPQPRPHHAAGDRRDLQVVGSQESGSRESTIDYRLPTSCPRPRLGTGKHQCDAARERRDADDRRQRNRFAIFRLHLHRPDVQHFVAIRITDAAHHQGENSEGDQNQPDELHSALRSSVMHAMCRTQKFEL